MSEDEDRSGLAAEYVLGTLDSAERDRAGELISTDPDFAALVADWERRLGELSAMVDPVPPPPDVWMAIKERLGETTPAAGLRLPELPEAPAPPVAPLEAAADAKVVDLTRRLRRWRGSSAALGALAAALAGIVVTAGLAPERLPAPLRPKPKIETVEVTREVVRTVEVPAPAPSRYVAVLQSSPSAPAFIMIVDVAQRSLTVRRVSAEEQANHSYELWLVSDRYPAPRSLGLIGASEFTRATTLANYEPDTISAATFAVSLEPEGGSPTGAPTGPVLFSGKLVEAVPPMPAGRTP
jgi:anti-sigma-K factor RskA